MEDLLERIDSLEARFGETEPEIHAYLPELHRFLRLRKEAQEFSRRYPKNRERPPLFGLLTGIKDIFRVDGFETRAGSRLPAETFAGAEASSVAALRAAGALVVGKTVTTEFAYFGPGPTRNPRNPAHTPGGSSSGSAAAAAAGLCDFALGTQTIGSINRPAAFCGIFGFKPSFDRIPKDGVIPLAPSFDHVGILTGDLKIAETVAAVLCQGWQPVKSGRKPRLGIPTGAYLDQADPTGLRHFEETTTRLKKSGHFIREMATLPDFESVRDRHRKVLAFETARVHRAWYDAYADRYHEKTRELIEQGLRIDQEDYNALLEETQRYRLTMRKFPSLFEIDAWVTPSAPGTAPAGLDSTGDPIMNLPWTQAGLPTLTLPTGTGPNGLPLGTQLVGGWYGDEHLFRIADAVLESLNR